MLTAGAMKDDDDDADCCGYEGKTMTMLTAVAMRDEDDDCCGYEG